MKQDLTKRSKYLSLLLRHKPEAGKIVLDKNGWAKVSDLIDGDKAGFKLKELQEIVTADEKGRYEFDNTPFPHTKIRAVQGHSIENIEIELEKAIPPGELFHGTKMTVLSMINKEGLKPMARQFVHLSADKKTAEDVANRRKGDSVILNIDSCKMAADGITFYKAKNGVWLTNSVHPKYITVLYK